MGLRKSLLATRLIGLPNTLRAVQYALRRDRFEGSKEFIDNEPIHPGRLLGAEPQPGGAVFRFENELLQVLFLAPDLIFLDWGGTGMAPSYAVEKFDWPPVKTVLTRSGADWQLTGDSLIVQASENGQIDFLQNGQLLRRETPVLRQGLGWRQTILLDPQTSVHGLGERAASLNLRPGTYRLWNRDSGSYAPGEDPLYITMPVFLTCQAGGCCLAFYDNSFDGQVTASQAIEILFNGGPRRYYLAFGSPAQALGRFTELVGRAPLPPRWALGYQHSRWGFRSEKTVRKVYAGFRQHRLPLSALVLDIDTMDGYRTLTVNTKKYPALPSFSQELIQEDVHLVAIVDPGVKVDPRYSLYRDGLEDDVFCRTLDGEVLHGVVWPGWSAFPDFSSSRVRAWWGQKYAGLIEQGFEGIWHDMNEPASFAAWGVQTFPVNTRHADEDCAAEHRQIHNVYGLLMNRAGYEGLRSLRPERRPFLLSRSGWVGMQKHCWSWTGDLEATWEMLRQTIPTVLGLGLCGMPYSGPDIGGSFGQPSTELYLRWFQLAAFLPFFRTHSAFYLPPREPWEFGEQALGIIRQTLEIRYQLMPYWYTLAWKASRDGLPLVRPLFWEHPTNPTLRSVEDAFLLGDSLLVAPILHPASEQRSVPLPPGTWFRLGDDEPIAGGRSITVSASLEEIPVFIRAGTILPMEKGGTLHLHIYRSYAEELPARGEIYSDAGDGYGAGRYDSFTLTESGGGWHRLEVEASGEAPWPYDSMLLRFHGFGDIRMEVDHREINPQDGFYPVPGPSGNVVLVRSQA